jgi:hypothetical protein
MTGPLPPRDDLGYPVGVARPVRRVVSLVPSLTDGLALDEIAGVLGLLQAAITGQEREDMLALARRMKINDIVAHALESCPRVTGLYAAS